LPDILGRFAIIAIVLFVIIAIVILFYFFEYGLTSNEKYVSSFNLAKGIIISIFFLQKGIINSIKLYIETNVCTTCTEVYFVSKGRHF